MRTHCKHGHELTSSNTYCSGNQLRCRKCNSLRYRGPRIEAALEYALKVLKRGQLNLGDIIAIEGILAGRRDLVP